MSIQNLVEFITEHAMRPVTTTQTDPSLEHSPARCGMALSTAAVCGRDLAAVCGRLVCPWRRLRTDRSAVTSNRTAHPNLTTESPASAIASRRPQAATVRLVRRRQHLTEGVVQFATADLALEHLVTAVEVLPLLGVDEAGSPLRREELNAC
jgi:hypothetical protein